MTGAQFKKEAFEQREVTLSLTLEEAAAEFPNVAGKIVIGMLNYRGWHAMIWKGKKTLIVRKDLASVITLA